MSSTKISKNSPIFYEVWRKIAKASYRQWGRRETGIPC